MKERRIQLLQFQKNSPVLMNKLNSSIKDVKDKGLIADYKEKQQKL